MSTQSHDHQISTTIETIPDSIKEKVTSLSQLHQKIQNQRLEALLAARRVLNTKQKKQIHDELHELISGGIKPHSESISINRNVDSYLYDD
jgi:hypothetical protein